ncbi:MAG TPA: aminopeptidase N, partial [Rhodanobacteraceae bacterium]|nr:aminopeptidase N [Rhodanobacteraceae bacterium]
MNPAAGAKPTVFLRDYRAPAWRVDEVALEFDLDPAATIVAARLHVVPDPDQAGAPLRLDGEGLELIELRIDGRVPASGEYELDAHALTIHGLAGPAVIETRARIAPEHNTALQGLYLSGARDAGFLVTQCEAEGFRRITWFLDRPDVLARYTVTLRADKTRFPLLLSNGNEAGRGDLDDGRHFARFVDPHPKPSYLFALVAGRLDRIEDEFVTAEGRRVRLAIHAESDLVTRCAWAMQCLKMAMR